MSSDLMLKDMAKASDFMMKDMANVTLYGNLMFNCMYYQKKFEEAKKALDDAIKEYMEGNEDGKSIQ